MTDELDIIRPAVPPSPRYAVSLTLSLPAYWRGAAATRASAYESDPSLLNGRGIIRAQRIEAALADVPEFGDWMKTGHA